MKLLIFKINNGRVIDNFTLPNSGFLHFGMVDILIVPCCTVGHHSVQDDLQPPGLYPQEAGASSPEVIISHAYVSSSPDNVLCGTVCRIKMQGSRTSIY